jgi:hypothetical protein
MTEENTDIEKDLEDTGVSVEMDEEGTEAPARTEGSEDSGDELDSYSKGVQTRIKKLTEKYRKEERDREEAVRLSQQLLEENKKLKSRVQQLDSGYLTEYGTRLESQLLAAKQEYKQAYDSGNGDALADAQLKLSNLAAEQQKYNAAKTRFQQQRVQVQQPAEQPAPAAAQPAAPAPQPQQANPDPKAQSWAQKNTWFGEDRVMTTAAFAVHQGLIEDEGFDPNSDEYYTELDKRMRREFPHKFQSQKSGGGTQVASAGSSASRSTKQGRRTVKLTPSQVAIAKKLNVPLEEYAKYVKD